MKLGGGGSERERERRKRVGRKKGWKEAESSGPHLSRWLQDHWGVFSKHVLRFKCKQVTFSFA